MKAVKHISNEDERVLLRGVCFSVLVLALKTIHNLIPNSINTLYLDTLLQYLDENGHRKF